MDKLKEKLQVNFINLIKSNNLELLEELFEIKNTIDEFLKDKENALETVKLDSNFIYNLPQEIRNDKDVILTASKNIEVDQDFITLLGPDLLTDTVFVNQLIENNIHIIYYLEKSFFEDKIFCLNAIKFGYRILENIPLKFLEDKEFVLKTIEYCPLMISVAKNFQDDEEVINTMLEKIKYDTSYFKYISPRLRDNKDIVLKFINKVSCNNIIEHISDRLKLDKDIVIKLIKNKNNVMRYLSNELKDNKELAELAIENNIDNFQFLSERLRGDKDLALKCLSKWKSYFIYTYLNNKLKNDPVFVNLFIEHAPSYNYHSITLIDKLPLKFKEDKEILMRIITKRPYEIKLINYDRDFLIEVLKKETDIIQHIKEEYKNDKEVIMLGIKNYNNKSWYPVAKFLSTEMKEDSEIKEFIISCGGKT